MKKNILIITLTVSLLCASNNQKVGIQNQDLKNELNSISEIPFVKNDILSSITFDEYTNDNYNILGHHIWSNEEIPTGIVLFGKSEGECHACGSNIIVFMLQYLPVSIDNDSYEWKIITTTHLAEQYGSWGNAPEPIFTKFGNKKYGFLFTSGYTSAGQSTEGVQLFTLIKNQFREVGNFVTHDDNSGEHGENDPRYFNTDSKISFIINSNTQFYDIKINTKEMRNIKNKKRPSTKTFQEFYRFDGEKYSTISAKK